MYFILFASCFFPLPPPPHYHHDKAPPVLQWFMNNGRLSVRQRRMMGKWVFLMVDWSILGLPLYVAPVDSQPALRFERRCLWVEWGVGLYLLGWLCSTWTEDTLWACECVTMVTGSVTDTSRSRLLSCLLFPLPPPILTPHWDTGHPHVAALPLCRTCQQCCVLCEAEGSVLSFRIKPVPAERQKQRSLFDVWHSKI